MGDREGVGKGLDFYVETLSLEFRAYRCIKASVRLTKKMHEDEYRMYGRITAIRDNRVEIVISSDSIDPIDKCTSFDEIQIDRSSE